MVPPSALNSYLKEWSNRSALNSNRRYLTCQLLSFRPSFRPSCVATEGTFPSLPSEGTFPSLPFPSLPFPQGKGKGKGKGSFGGKGKGKGFLRREREREGKVPSSLPSVPPKEPSFGCYAGREEGTFLRLLRRKGRTLWFLRLLRRTDGRREGSFAAEQLIASL